MYNFYRPKVAPTSQKGVMAMMYATDSSRKTAVRKKLLVQDRCHPFYAGFRIICWLHRLTGCCFLENLGSSDAADVRARRFSMYLLYPLCVWLYFNVVSINLLIDVDERMHAMGATSQLNVTIFLLFFLALNLEWALSGILLLLQAPKLVEVLRMCELIELYNAVPPYMKRETVRFAWAVLAFQLVETVLYMALTALSRFGTALLVEEGRQLDPFLMGLAISHGIVGVPYLVIVNTSTRLVATYFSRAITLYVRCIHRSMDRCLRSRSTPENRKVQFVDHVRVQLSLIKNCVDMVSTLVGPCLLYTYAYTVAVLCASSYYTIIPEPDAPVRIFFFIFGLLHCLSILMLPLTAHRMKAAVAELRTVVYSVLVEDCSDELLVQLRLTLSTTKPHDLKFTACGFFAVDLSTIADIMGAVITYTVVLVQTNESYRKGHLGRCDNVTVV